MADKTGIEWTDATWNPLRGCSRVSEGCRHCYAESVAKRFSGPGLPYEGLIAKGGQWNGQIKLVPELLDQPLRWRRPRRIFVNSMSDLFHENVPGYFIDTVFQVMSLARQHTFQILTKRPERMLAYFKGLEVVAARHAENVGRFTPADVINLRFLARNPHAGRAVAPADRVWPLPNVWLGVSVEDQDTATKRESAMREIAAMGWMTWVSYEPALGAVDWAPWMEFLGWAVCGGESGKDARPMHPDWARQLRDQCASAGVPFLFKQWGEWVPAAIVGHAGLDASGNPIGGAFEFADQTLTYHAGFMEKKTMKLDATHTAFHFGKKAAGRLLDGVLHDGYPEVKP